MPHNVEIAPKFDIRVENTKRFFAPFQENSQKKLVELQLQQEKYEAAMSKHSVIRAINKIFQIVKDPSEDISNSKSELIFIQSMIELVQAGEYGSMIDYLTKMLDSLISAIEKLQKEFSGRPVRWSTVNEASDIPFPRLFLTDGVMVLNQLDPVAAEPFNKRLANMKIDKAIVDLRSATE